MENKNYPQRKRIRLHDYDYTVGTYFITICTANRVRILSTVADSGVGANIIRPFSPILTDIGEIVKSTVEDIPTHYPNVQIDDYVIMPDHVHIILSLSLANHGRTMFAPTLQRIIKHLKGSVTKKIGSSIWQKSFYEHSIRDASDYDEKMKYLYENPMRWCYKK